MSGESNDNVDLNSLENKRLLMNLIRKNASASGKSGLNKLNRNRSRKNFTITVSRSDLNFGSNSDSSDIEFDTHKLSNDDGSLIPVNSEGIQRTKRIKRNHNAETNEKQPFASSIRCALTDLSDKLNILSKTTAELDTAISFHRESPLISSQLLYSSNDPVPSYVGDADHTFSDEMISVTVPTKNVAEVDDLNKILENVDAFNKTVRKYNDALFRLSVKYLYI